MADEPKLELALKRFEEASKGITEAMGLLTDGFATKEDVDKLETELKNIQKESSVEFSQLKSRIGDMQSNILDSVNKVSEQLRSCQNEILTATGRLSFDKRVGNRFARSIDELTKKFELLDGQAGVLRIIAQGLGRGISWPIINVGRLAIFGTLTISITIFSIDISVKGTRVDFGRETVTNNISYIFGKPSEKALPTEEILNVLEKRITDKFLNPLNNHIETLNEKIDDHLDDNTIHVTKSKAKEIAGEVTKQTTEPVTLTLGDNGVLFGINSKKIRLAAHLLISEISQHLIKSGENRSMLLIGHADEYQKPGTEKATQEFDYNVELSTSRAHAVAKLFASSYINAPVYYIGVGSLFPKVANKSNSGAVKNRRVELILCELGCLPHLASILNEHNNLYPNQSSSFQGRQIFSSLYKIESGVTQEIKPSLALSAMGVK